MKPLEPGGGAADVWAVAAHPAAPTQHDQVAQASPDSGGRELSGTQTAAWAGLSNEDRKHRVGEAT